MEVHESDIRLLSLCHRAWGGANLGTLRFGWFTLMASWHTSCTHTLKSTVEDNAGYLFPKMASSLISGTAGVSQAQPFTLDYNSRHSSPLPMLAMANGSCELISSGGLRFSQPEAYTYGYFSKYAQPEAGHLMSTKAVRISQHASLYIGFEEEGWIYSGSW